MLDASPPAGKVPVYCVVAEFVGVFLFQFIGGGADANSISTGPAAASAGFLRCRARGDELSR